MDPLLTLSATALAAKIRNREVTSREVVETHIARVQKVNPILNAMVRDRFVEARKEATFADEKTKTESAEALPPFHGVPCSIKEAFALTGMPQSSGLMARKDAIATTDAVTVARLRAAGAIPLGVTNLSELCMWMESDNRVYGRTNNPYDVRRTAGGSSGGEGALVGAGGTPFGLGADIGGSIRMPAFFNGVFGHKPGGGVVPGSGQYPIAENAALRYLSTGPLARRAEDLMPLLRVLAGPDGEDTGCEHCVLGDPATVDMKGLLVTVVEGNGSVPVTDELKSAQRRAAEALKEAGAQIRTLQIADLRHSFDIWGSMLGAAGGKSFRVLLGNGRPARAGWEFIKLLFNRSHHTLPAIGLALLERLPELTPARTKRFVEMGLRLKEELVREIGDGVLLYPPYASVAPKHGHALLPPFKWVYTAIFNVMELPVTQVPLGLDHQGVPLGVQVAAGPGGDHRSIAVALELEKRLGGWVPPPAFSV